MMIDELSALEYRAKNIEYRIWQKYESKTTKFNSKKVKKD